MRGPRPCANSTQGYEAAVIGDVIAITVFAFPDRLRRPHRITCPAGGQPKCPAAYPFAARARTSADRNVKSATLRACNHKIAIGDSDLINVRFGPLCDTDREILGGPKSDKARNRCAIARCAGA